MRLWWDGKLLGERKREEVEGFGFVGLGDRGKSSNYFYINKLYKINKYKNNL
jgi:hypothetical protein